MMVGGLNQVRGDVRGYGATLPSLIGSEVASEYTEGRSKKEINQAIYIGVATGVLVWSVTRALDYFVFRKKGGRK